MLPPNCVEESRCCGAVNLGQREISAALGSILLYTYPLMAAVVSPLFLGERIDRWKIAGIALGFVGILFVVFGHRSGRPLEVKVHIPA